MKCHNKVGFALSLFVPLKASVLHGSNDAAVQGDAEDLGSCAWDAGTSLLQSSLSVQRGIEPLNAGQPVEQARNFASKTGISTSSWERKHRNVLFIVADDLRPMVSGLNQGAPHMQTPNLDSFIKDSLVLANSHAQQSSCTPSRTSLLFGRRPDTMHVWGDRYANVRAEGCTTCKTIPQLFKDAGYYTVGMGKVFGDDAKGGPYVQDPESWSDPAFSGGNWFFGQALRNNFALSWRSVDEKVDGPLQDSQVREHAVSWLHKLTRSNLTQPWFLAVGFRKPHLPFTCPKEFYDLYKYNETRLANNPYAPQDMPPIAHSSTEVNSYKDIKATGYLGAINELLVEYKAKQLVHGYRACVSYLDHNVGVLLSELKTLGQWNDTIIVFWADHGWKLGEHGAWAKETNFYVDTHAPLMLRVPGLTDGGIVSEALVEHVDVMASLLDVAGLNPLPTCPRSQPWLTSECTEGHSFLSLAWSPDATWKNASYSQFDRAGVRNESHGLDPANIGQKAHDLLYMGYSMTTNRKLRFTAWVDFDEASRRTSFSMDREYCGFELYNHSIDPDENRNLAYQSGYKTLVQELFMQLKLGWRATSTLL